MKLLCGTLDVIIEGPYHYSDPVMCRTEKGKVKDDRWLDAEGAHKMLDQQCQSLY